MFELNSIEDLKNRLASLMNEFRKENISLFEVLRIFDNIIQSFIRNSDFNEKDEVITEITNQFLAMIKTLDSIGKLNEREKNSMNKNKFLRSQLGLT